MTWDGDGDQVKVLSLSDRMRSPSELEALFQEKQALLIQFLTLRLGDAAEAQDAAQLVFMRLWERRADLRNENLAALLFVTARNLATDILRSRRSGRLAVIGRGDYPQELIQDEAPSPERVAAARSELAIVRLIIDELPPKCREAFLALQVEGLEYRQIAARMGLTESMVRKYVRRATLHCVSRYAVLEGWE